MCYIFPNVYFFKKIQLKSLTGTCYSVPTALPALAAAHVSAAAGSSAHRPGTSHDPGGPAVVNLQPPPIYRYPSFSSSLGQRIVDVVGRSRMSEVLKILNAFDDSTKQVQLFMEKAVEYIFNATDLTTP